jgi:hypothetical protein
MWSHLQDYIDRWRYNANRAPQAQMKLKILQKLWVAFVASRHLNLLSH